MATSITSEIVLLKASEVAKVLRLSLDATRRLIAEGRIKGFKIHGRWRVRATALDDFVSSQTKRKE